LHYRNTAFDTAFQKPFYAEGSKAFVFPMALPECKEGPKTNDFGTNPLFLSDYLAGVDKTPLN